MFYQLCSIVVPGLNLNFYVALSLRHVVILTHRETFQRMSVKLRILMDTSKTQLAIYAQDMIYTEIFYCLWWLKTCNDYSTYAINFCTEKNICTNILLTKRWQPLLTTKTQQHHTTYIYITPRVLTESYVPWLRSQQHAKSNSFCSTPCRPVSHTTNPQDKRSLTINPN